MDRTVPVDSISRLAHLRVILFFYPIRDSSWNQISMSLPRASWAAIRASLAGKVF